MVVFLLYILLVWLVVYRFIAVDSINLVLSFFADVVAPLLKLDDKIVRTFKSVRHQLNIDSSVQKYAVCKKCCRLRRITDLDPIRLGEVCANPHCGEPIVKSKSGKPTRTPRLVYAYYPITEWLRRLLAEERLQDRLEEWRDQPRTPGIHRDMMDGSAWSKQRDGDGQPWHDAPLSLSIAFGLDGFSCVPLLPVP